MTSATAFATIYLYFWLVGGLSEILCSAVSVNGNSSSTKNQTIRADKRTMVGTDRISQTERNRRLIPYATYYIAGNSASAAGSLDQENSLLSTASPTQSNDDQDQEDPGQPKSSVKIPYKAAENGEYYDYQDNNEYSYIPVAYIPGAAPSRGINYNPETHYYPNSYYQSPISTENSKYYQSTARPGKPSPAPSTTTERKFPFSYLTKYVAQHNIQNDDYYKYLVTPATLKHQINYEIKKPNGVAGASAAAAAAAAYYAGDTSPAIGSTPAPQSEYLNFRYNLYKTQAPKYDVTTTPSTVEITSPKHYLVNKVVSSTYPSQHIGHVTTPYAVTYDYSEEQYAAHTQTPKPVTKIPEQATQSTKTLMTIMKSQELPYQLQQQHHLQQYHHHQHHHQIPTRIQFVPKPYLVPTLNTPAATAVIDYTVDDILAGYNINKQLPEKITADNIKQSIKTLSYILQVLQKADSISQYTDKPHTAIAPHFNSKEIFDSLKETPHSAITPIEHNSVSPLPHHVHSYDPYDDTPKEPTPTTHIINKPLYKDDQSTPGRAGIDYPVLSVIPETTFDCKTQRYKGFFADPATKCQVWHYCDLNGGQASFLCPNGTIFNQAALTCDWWFNVKCAATPQLYVLNERLYKYIIPARPSFPEDYSGPLVDQYLTEKFREIESQRKHKYPTNSTASKIEAAANLTALSEYDIPSHLLDENL